MITRPTHDPNAEPTHRTDTIEGFLERIVSAWNAGDATAYAEEFTDDATYVVFMGLVLRGREAIEAEHVPVFSTYQRGSRMSIRVLDVRMPADDVAVVVSVGGIGTGRRIPEDKVQSFTLVREEGRWRCAAFQNTKQQRLMLRMHALFNRRIVAAASAGPVAA